MIEPMPTASRGGGASGPIHPWFICGYMAAVCRELFSGH